MTESSVSGMVLLCAVLMVPLAVVAEIRLPSVIGPNMVLQREIAVPIWGWAEPGREVTVEFAEQRTTTVVGSDGKWMVRLDPMPASDVPRNLRLVVSGADSQPTVSVTNVLVGDVWLGSGQSNMGTPVSMVQNGAAAVAAASDPLIRLFRVPVVVDRQPQDDTDAHWNECSPTQVRAFSAAMYFFGRHLRRELGVPVGLIQSAQGGASCIPWASRASLETVEDFRPLLDHAAVSTRDPVGTQSRYREDLAAWEKENVPEDPGNTGYAQGWAASATAGGWQSISLPRDWDWDELTVEGGRWFRRDVEIPQGWEGKKLTLSLGASADLLTVYYQNVRVGGLGRDEAPTRLTMVSAEVPGDQVKAGRATIAVRAVRYLGGGLIGPATSMVLRGPRGNKPIPLGGEWMTRSEFDAPVGDRLFYAPLPPLELMGGGYPGYPAAMYNGMIAPLVPFALRGVCWYQGESNVRSAAEYQVLLPTLIRGWREAWGQGDFPFLIVQLANFTAGPPWAELQEAQAFVAAHVPGCGLVVANDIGDADDIHPANKQEVGRRLSLLALAGTYERKEVACSGPVYRSMTVESSVIHLAFRHTEGGLAVRGDGELTGFTIAGADRKFVPASARIEGDKVVVWNKNVVRPVAVRYAWTGNPKANLCNGVGLPASCFRTDRWPPDVRTRRPRYS